MCRSWALSLISFTRIRSWAAIRVIAALYGCFQKALQGTGAAMCLSLAKTSGWSLESCCHMFERQLELWGQLGELSLHHCTQQSVLASTNVLPWWSHALARAARGHQLLAETASFHRSGLYLGPNPLLGLIRVNYVDSDIAPSLILAEHFGWMVKCFSIFLFPYIYPWMPILSVI